MIEEETATPSTAQAQPGHEKQVASSQPLTRTYEARLWLGSALTLSVPIAAGLLCGAKLPWTRGLVFGLMAIAIIATGKGRHLPKWLVPVLIGLSLWGLTGLLPLSWFQIPGWRLTMQDDFDFSPVSTLSPQPWVTWEAWTLMAGGIIWAVFSIGAGFREKHRRFLLRGLVFGITLMALLALVMKWGTDQGLGEQVYRHLKDPRYFEQFGLFANRNNFAGICVTGFLLAIMTAFDAWQRKQFLMAAMIMLCAIPVFLAVLDSGSRGGVLLLTTGLAAWLVTLLFRRQSRQYFSVAAALLLMVGSLILLFGKPIVQRFISTVQENGLSKDARVHVFHDTFEMLSEHPVLGIGLGNFENVFPRYQLYTNHYTRFIHPESDWLWMAAESGVIGLVLTLSAVILLVSAALRRGKVKSSSTDRNLRHAALIVAAITGIQGLFDTPAHLLANALTAILLLSLATQRERTAPPRFANKLCTSCFLFSSAAVISINSWATSISQPLWPSRSAAIKLRAEAQTLLNLKQPATAYPLLNKAIEFEPMAWDGYFMRACVQLQLGRSPQTALLDFARARFLEPNSNHLCMLEATYWLNYNPPYAVQAWREAMRRDPAMAPVYYNGFLHQLKLHPDLREGLFALATTPELQIQFLGWPDNSAYFKAILDDLLSHSSKLEQLNDYDQLRLFKAWNQWGDREELINLLKLNPVWRKNGWLILAEEFARLNDYRGAYEIALRYIKPPLGHGRSKKIDIASLRTAFLHNPNDIKFAFDLFEAQKNASLFQDAMSTLNQIEELDPKSLHRVLYEKALLHAIEGNYVSAWEKIKTYAYQQ